MSIETILSQAATQAVKEIYGVEVSPSQITVQKNLKKDIEGNMTIVVFPLLRASHKSPEATGQELGEWLSSHCDAVEKFNVIKGFLNVTISASFWSRLLRDISADEKYGLTAVSDTSDLVMIEYSSPNTNKPLHLGHVRNNLLGYSLALIMEANGHRVVKTNIVNDRGIHICKSMLAWQKWGNGATPLSTGKKGDHLIGDFYVEFDKRYKAEIKELIATKGVSEEEAASMSPLMLEARAMLKRWEDGDPEVRALWKEMNDWVYAGFDETYKRLGVSFDKIYYESETYMEGKEKVMEGLEKGLFYRKDDGSVWADLTADGLDHKLLLRSDGTSVYMTQDIGTAKLRYQDFPIDKMIYVVGNEQEYHFQVLSLLLDKLGFKWGKDLIHFSYGMVELPDGKMKSREGTVVDADDLMDKMVAGASEMTSEPGRLEGVDEAERAEIARVVGLGALKYFILKVDPRKNMLFNSKESIKLNGDTGPFVQYTYARIRSILRKAAAEPAQGVAGAAVPNEKEAVLIQRIADFKAVVKDAGDTYSPALIAGYAFDLAKEFNQYYHDYSILREENADVKAFRLALAKVTARTLKQAFALLGIEMPERM